MRNYRNGQTVGRWSGRSALQTPLDRRTDSAEIVTGLLCFRLLLLRLLHLDQLILLESLRYSRVHLQTLVEADVRATILLLGDRPGCEIEHTIIETGLRQTIVDREQFLDLLYFVRYVRIHRGHWLVRCRLPSFDSTRLDSLDSVRNKSLDRE